MVLSMWGKLNRKKIGHNKRVLVVVPTILLLVVFSGVFFPVYFRGKALKAEMTRFVLTVDAVEITDMFAKGRYTLKFGAGYRAEYVTYPVKLEGCTYALYEEIITNDYCYGTFNGYVYNIELKVKLGKITSQKIALPVYTSATGIFVWSSEFRFEKFGGSIKIHYSFLLAQPLE